MGDEVEKELGVPFAQPQVGEHLANSQSAGVALERLSHGKKVVGTELSDRQIAGSLGLWIGIRAVWPEIASDMDVGTLALALQDLAASEGYVLVNRMSS